MESAESARQHCPTGTLEHYGVQARFRNRKRVFFCSSARVFMVSRFREELEQFSFDGGFVRFFLTEKVICMERKKNESRICYVLKGALDVCISLNF
jgi:hypothetical protein